MQEKRNGWVGPNYRLGGFENLPGLVLFLLNGGICQQRQRLRARVCEDGLSRVLCQRVALDLRGGKRERKRD